MGWLARQYGLACDNVASYTMVTADGEVVRASRDREPGPVLGAARRWRQLRHRHRVRVPAAPGRHAGAGRRVRPSRSSDAVPALRALARPERRGAAAGDLHRLARPATAWSTVGFVWVGDPARGHGGCCRRCAASGARSPRASRARPTSSCRRRDDTTGGHALRRYSKGHYLPALPDEAIEAFLQRGGDGLGRASAERRAAGVRRRDRRRTRRRRRRSATGTRCSSTARHRLDRPRRGRGADGRRAALRRRALDPFASGVYVNALSDDGAEGVRRAYSAATSSPG